MTGPMCERLPDLCAIIFVDVCEITGAEGSKLQCQQIHRWRRLCATCVRLVRGLCAVCVRTLCAEEMSQFGNEQVTNETRVRPKIPLPA